MASISRSPTWAIGKYSFDALDLGQVIDPEPVIASAVNAAEVEVCRRSRLLISDDGIRSDELSLGGIAVISKATVEASLRRVFFQTQTVQWLDDGNLSRRLRQSHCDARRSEEFGGLVTLSFLLLMDLEASTDPNGIVDLGCNLHSAVGRTHRASILSVRLG